MKGMDEKLDRMKKIQDASDNDMELDLTKRHKALHRSRELEKKAIARKEASEDSRKDTRNLLILLGALFGIFVVFMLVLALYRPERTVMTIDELHAANAAGTLDPEQGYIYNGYSFVQQGGVWYSQVQKGSTVYDITFNFDPKSVENITVDGRLSSRFKQGNKLYITFDPRAYSTKYIAVANAGLSLSLVKGFGYNLTAGCTSNESALCRSTAVISCDDKEKAVIYFKEDAEPKVVLMDNCVTIQGMGPDIVRAKDRLLLRWYNIMD